MKASECHRDAGVFQAHREDSLVDLVELHQLQEVYKERQAIIHGEVLPASFFALCRPEKSKVSDVRHLDADRMRFSKGVKGTHRDYQVVFDRQLVTQRQDKTLSVLVALTNQKHAITNRNTLVNLHPLSPQHRGERLSEHQAGEGAGARKDNHTRSHSHQ